MATAPDKPKDEFSEYFSSDTHNARMEEARRRTLERLIGIAQGAGDGHALLPAFSEAIGTLFGIGDFYRRLGLKHQFARIFREIYTWLKKGSD